jgi:hypothetical protein
MKTWTLKLLPPLLLLMIGTASGAPAPRPAARLVVDEPHFDFGPQPNHLTIEHTFVLRNEGQVTLEIQRIHSSCGCTAGAPSSRRIEPGATAELTARYNLTGREGPQRSVLTLETNDPDHPRTQLILSGEATTPLRVRPPLLYFGDVHAAHQPEEEALLQGHPGQPFDITNIELDHAAFRVADIETIHPHAYRIRVAIDTTAAETGNLEGRMTVHTTLAELPVVTLPLQAYVVGPLRVAPLRITLMGDNDQLVTRFIVVRPGSVRQFKVTRVEPPSDTVQVRITDLQDQGYRIQLSGIQATAEWIRQPVRIYTDLESLPVIEVPFDILEIER